MNPIEDDIDICILRGIHFGDINRQWYNAYSRIQMPRMCRARSVYGIKLRINLDNQPNITTI